MSFPCQPLASREQSRELDSRAAARGLSGESLMEEAGSKAAQRILERYPKARSFAVFCGPGHNGGDGWAAARCLNGSGRRAAVYAFKSSRRLVQIQRRKALASGVPAKKWNQWEPAEGEVLIDAVFGSGLSRSVKGDFFALISRIRDSRLPVASLDMPSGLCASTGRVLGLAVKASLSLTFALGKLGLYIGEGPAHAGKLEIIPLSFPRRLLDQVCSSFFLVSKKSAARVLPSLPPEANKSHRGRTLIAAGRRGLWGCGLLACRGAITAGSGYVTWAGNPDGEGAGDPPSAANDQKAPRNRGAAKGSGSDEYPYEGLWKAPEILTLRLNDPQLFHRQTAIAAGPGLGFSASAERFLLRLQGQGAPAVLDADALTLIAARKTKALSRPGKNRLMTPHSGELSRLLGIPAKDIERGRPGAAAAGAKAFGCWLLLKGFRSVLSDGKKSYIIASGNSALGKAGTGDVLTGMAAGLLAQGLPLPEAAALAASLHGAAAERWIRLGRDISSFSAAALLDELPFVMSEFRSLASGRPALS